MTRTSTGALLWMQQQRWLLVGLFVILTTEFGGWCADAYGVSTRIQVCQNKDCRQRWKLQTPLPEVIHDLIIVDGTSTASVSIESTGCLSQCNLGPNVCATIRTASSSTSKDLNGLNDAVAVVTELESLSIPIPSKLLAAVNVLERAQLASNPEEKERCASSVINALQSEPTLKGSSAYARAHVIRAEVYASTGRSDLALDDAKTAVQLLAINQCSSDVESLSLLMQARAYRVMADVYEASNEYVSAIDALQAVAKCNPALRTKVNQELDRLQRQSQAY